MSSTKTSLILTNFLSFLRNSKKQYEKQYNIVGMKDKETCDYLHKLELIPLNYHDEAKLAKELKKTRRERRKAKDATVILKPIVNWIEKNKSVIRSMEKLLGDVRSEEQKLKNRHYIPRVLKEKDNPYNKTTCNRDKTQNQSICYERDNINDRK